MAKENNHKDLLFSYKNRWHEVDETKMKEIMDFSEDYKEALNKGKTERQFVAYAINLLREAGFVPLTEMDKLAAGDKVYMNVRNCGLVAAVVGSSDPLEGFNLVGAHVDSPRLDLKPYPFYEKADLTLMKTHYYGGIKKYQWGALPLSLHGVIHKPDGTLVEISIGEDVGDPVFCVTDLLPHLGKQQMERKANEIIKGEELNLLVGGIPFPDEETEQRFKLGVLQILNRKYGLTEKDFVTAEIQAVPAHPARDVGFDRAFIGAYGQDDRVSAFTALRALIDLKQAKRTALVLLFDKEEVGSMGNTGAESDVFMNIQSEIFAKQLDFKPDYLDYQRNLANSLVLSSDVTNAFDPTFEFVSDPLNSAYAGRGISFAKYVGARGKGGTTDASSEYFSAVIRLMDEHDIAWQTGEMGKVDEGGGGTVAMFQAAMGMEVIDCGVPVLSMHSCFEVTSKLDVYETYRANKVFLEEMRLF
ncbi:MAG TPA: aminopeptidase [Clostridiaceae bacterium]|nr:aminopeptidase [Clostridiaceae bacterium]